MPDEILRTFVAIELEEPLRVAIAQVQGKLKRQTPPGSVKWVAAGGIHHRNRAGYRVTHVEISRRVGSHPRRRAERARHRAQRGDSRSIRVPGHRNQ